MITLDITLIFQLANFLVTLVALNWLLIKPIRDIVRQRRDVAKGFLNDAEAFSAEADKRLRSYEAALACAREEAVLKRDAKKSEALELEAATLVKAQQDAQEYLSATREQTQTAVSKAMKTLQERIPVLAVQVAEKLLGKKSRMASKGEYV